MEVWRDRLSLIYVLSSGSENLRNIIDLKLPVERIITFRWEGLA